MTHTPRGFGPSFAVPLLGAALIGGGLVLLIERLRAEGLDRLWPLLLLAFGAAGVGLGPDARDEAWWLIGTGASLLAESLAGMAARLADPAAILAAGLITLRVSLVGNPPSSVRGDAHD